MPEPELTITQTTRSGSVKPVTGVTQTYLGESLAALRETQRKPIPAAVSLSFGSGYERVRKVLSYTMSSPITKAILNDFYTREEPTLKVDISGTELGYSLKDAVIFYEYIIAELESFNITVSMLVEEEVIAMVNQLTRATSVCHLVLSDS